MIKVRNTQGLRNKKKIICFPYAGGSASFYTKWNNEIKEIKICPVQLLGREESFREEKIYDINTEVEQIVNIIEKYVDQNTIFFGHSMGAKIAYEFVKAFKKKGKRIQFLEKVKRKEMDKYAETRSIC